MSSEVIASVWRNLDNRNEGLSDDSPRAWELHRMRSMALHEVLDNVDGLEVKSWGDTDDSQRTHEVVEIIIEFGKWLAQPEQLQAMGTAAIGIGKVVGTAAIGAGVKEGVQWLFEKLRKKQKEGQIESASLKPAPMIEIRIDPPKWGGRTFVTVQVEGEPYQN
jgi:hypothetical protein